MIIIETCPKCGNRLHDLVLASFPPIPAKTCSLCGYYWQGEPEKIGYVPFNPDNQKYEIGYVEAGYSTT